MSSRKRIVGLKDPTVTRRGLEGSWIVHASDVQTIAQRHGSHPMSVSQAWGWGYAFAPGGAAPEASGAVLYDAVQDPNTLLACNQDRTFFWRGLAANHVGGYPDVLFGRWYGSLAGGIRLRLFPTGYPCVEYSLSGTSLYLYGATYVNPWVETTLSVSIADTAIRLYLNGVLDAEVTGLSIGRGIHSALVDKVVIGASLDGYFGHYNQRCIAVGVLNTALDRADSYLLALDYDGFLLGKQAGAFFAPTITIFHPASDITVAGWTASNGSTIASCIGEDTRSDAEWATSPDLTGGSAYFIDGLDGTVPAGTWGASVASDRLGAAGQFRVSLLDASNAVQGTSSWQAVTGSFADYSVSITTTGAATRVKLEVSL